MSRKWEVMHRWEKHEYPRDEWMAGVAGVKVWVCTKCSCTKHKYPGGAAMYSEAVPGGCAPLTFKRPACIR